jgi:hypothetical protein
MLENRSDLDGPRSDPDGSATATVPAPVSVSIPSTASLPFTSPAPGFETEEFDVDGTSVLFGSYVTTDLILGDLGEISVQSTIGTNAANLPPAPPPPDEPVPGVYEEPSH